MELKPENGKFEETSRIDTLRQKLEEGEMSGLIDNFDPQKHLSDLNKNTYHSK